MTFYYSAANPFMQIFNLRGTGLNNGSVYFGVEGMDPITNPKSVYWDSAGLDEAAQPIPTTGGYLYRDGTPANVFLSGPYSIKVLDGNGSLVYYQASVLDEVLNFITELQTDAGAGLVGFQQDGAEAQARTVDAKLKESVSVLDFYKSSDGADYGPALIRAVAAHNAVFFPPRSTPYPFISNQTITLTHDVAIDFNGQSCTHTNARITLQSPEVASGLTLAANAARYATQVTLSSAAGISAGDLLYMNCSQTPSSAWTDTKKETIRVASVSGAVVTLEAPLNFSWTTADPGLSIKAFRPYSVSFEKPDLTLIASDGDTTTYIMYLVQYCADNLVNAPKINGQKPFTRATNIYRNGIVFDSCWNMNIDDATYFAMSQPIGIYGGSRNVQERNTNARYMHHSHADMGGWSSDYRCTGLISNDSFGSVNAHPSFRVYVEDFTVTNDTNLINLRTVGGGLKRGRVLNQGAQETAQFQSIPMNAGFEYLYDDADFIADDVELNCPNWTNATPLRVTYGRTFRASDCRGNSPVFFPGAGTDVALLIDGGGNVTKPVGYGFFKPQGGASFEGVPNPRVPAVNTSGAVYVISLYDNMVDQTTNWLKCYGPIVMQEPGAPDAIQIEVRIVVNGFAGTVQPDKIIGKLKLLGTVFHDDSGLGATLEKDYNFFFKISDVTAGVFPTTPVFTSSASGQTNENLTLAVSSPAFNGETTLGPGDQQYRVAFVLDATATGRTNPVFNISYELELQLVA